VGGGGGVAEPANVLELLKKNVVDCGKLYVSKTSLGAKRSGERYLIYLPISRNYLWKILHDSKVKVTVFLQLPENLPEKTAEGRERVIEKEG
jgi:putative cell wall-binding protein